MFDRAWEKQRGQYSKIYVNPSSMAKLDVNILFTKALIFRPSLLA